MQSTDGERSRHQICQISTYDEAVWYTSVNHADGQLKLDLLWQTYLHSVSAAVTAAALS